MTTAYLEHVNLTVTDPDQLANLLCDLFNWQVRWSGDALDNGYTVHVGSDQYYLALYTHDAIQDASLTHLDRGALNHIGISVSNVDEIQTRLLKHGIKSKNHRNYGVCKSFYFMADDQLEIEVVSYT